MTGSTPGARGLLTSRTDLHGAHPCNEVDRALDYLQHTRKNLSTVGVERDLVARRKGLAPEPDPPCRGIDDQILATHQADHAELARHHRRVRGPRPGRREESPTDRQGGDVAGRGRLADEDHFGTRLGDAPGVLDLEGDAPGGDPDARRGGQRERPSLGGDGKPAPDDRFEVVAGKPFECGRLVDAPLSHEIADNLEGRPWCALCCPGLEQPEHAVLDGQLEVLGVAEHRLKGATQAFEAVGEAWDGLGKTLGSPGPVTSGNDVLALGVDEEVEVEPVRPGSRVPGEPHPRARGGAEVAKDHGLNRHCRADEVLEALKALKAAVLDGTRCPPGAEHRLDGSGELLEGVSGNGRPLSSR